MIAALRVIGSALLLLFVILAITFSAVTFMHGLEAVLSGKSWR